MKNLASFDWLVPRALIRGWVAVLLLGAVNAQPAAAQTPQSFRFTLDSAYTTSAGVYTADGTLVRALWSKQPYAAGTHTQTWDGKTDEGAAATAGSYQFKVLYHNVRYAWDGAIANTSEAQSGASVHHAFRFTRDLAITGTKAFYLTGYNEGQYDFHQFSTTTPQRVDDSWTWRYNTQFSRVEKGTSNIFDRNWHFATTDGTWTYFAATDATDPANRNRGNAAPGFVTAVNVSDNSQAYFTVGQRIVNGPPDDRPGFPDYPFPNGVYVGTQPGLSGLAVQTGGNLLAVAVAPDNKVYLLDKRSGSVLRSFVVTSPKRLAFAPNGDLWVVSSTAVARYTNLAATPGLASTLSGLVKPLAVAVDLTNDLVVVADGGTSQQLKAYSSTGSPLWTHGQAGGYASSPDVTNDKFYFISGEDDNSYEDTFVSFAPDGTFWVGDIGNDRALHLRASDRSYLEQISFNPHSYSTWVDANAPTRVFDRFLEFEVDYRKPLAGNNGSWRLVRNWRRSLPDSYRDDRAKSRFLYGLAGVATLANGRTYGEIPDPEDLRIQTLVELTATGLRLTGISLPRAGNGGGKNTTLRPDGSLQTVYVDKAAKWEKQALTGFDAAGNPQHGPVTLLAQVANVGDKDPYPGCCGSGTTLPAITASDIVVSYDQSKRNNGPNTWHLGGVKVGESTWKFKTLPAVTSAGFYVNPTAGEYVTGDGVNYGGNVAVVSGRHIVAGYHGEGWQQGQANQFFHYYDNGLFLGQYGVPARNPDGSSSPPGEVRAGFAGNSFSPQLIRVNGELYMWVNDESGHGPQRWHLVGAGRVGELSGTFGAPPDPGTLPNGTYRLLARHSGKVLDVSGISQAEGADVIQSALNGGPNQQWQVTATGNGYYQLLASHSGKALDVQSSGINNGTRVQQWTGNGTAAQRWKIEPTSDGYYKLTAECSGKVLDVSNASAADGALVHQWDYIGGLNQQWQLVPVLASTRVATATTSRDTSRAELAVFPNPTRGRLMVDYVVAAPTPVQLQLRNALGRVHFTQTRPARAAGWQRAELSVADLPAGLYLLDVRPLGPGPAYSPVKVLITK